MTGTRQSEVLPLHRSLATINTPSLARGPGEPPHLLVSVRSSEEAKAAIEGGANILDMKEPSRGSLGMADLHEICKVATLTAGIAPAIPLSVALGELTDWQSASEVPALPEQVTYVKLGLRGCAGDPRWRSRWKAFRERVEARLHATPNWVGVSYADADATESPAVDEVFDAAVEANCAGLLIDTCAKDRGTLLDYLDVKSLTAIAQRCHASRMFLALAGRLDQSALSALTEVAYDVIAIRSAACLAADRTASVNARCIADFREQLRRSIAANRTKCV